jgi:signal recognition particle receptor subunit beta
MSLVNFAAREITCKIVYYGPGRSGKTTNLQYIFGRVPEPRRGRMVSLATHGDRTLFFDFLPLDLGSISGFQTRFQLYTVPGQSYYNATRRLVLQGADGVVFVADSQARRFEENLESLQNLHENLLGQGVDVRQLPVVFQYNKQDLPSELVLDRPALDDALNFRAGAELRRRRLARRRGVSRRSRVSPSWCCAGCRRAGWRAGMTELSAVHRFDTLVVGAANRTAVTAARAVAETPGSVYNPLFIYSRPGLGKTHLLVAIGHAVRAVNPAASVAYLTLDEFVEDYHSAVASGRGGGVPPALRPPRTCCCSTTCSSLAAGWRCTRSCCAPSMRCRPPAAQIVLTSDRPPAEIESLDERLLRRVAGGLVIDISRPDFETQVAILRRKAEERGAPFGTDVLEAVATLGIESVRELIGALNRLIAFQAVSEAPLDPHQARVLIGGPRCSRMSVPCHRRRRRRRRLPQASARHPSTRSRLEARRGRLPRRVRRLPLGACQPRWRSRSSRGARASARAILRWEGEGVRTTVLNRLLEQGRSSDADGSS